MLIDFTRNQRQSITALHRYDEAGDLLTRKRSDAVNAAPSVEYFTYDLLNRVTGTTDSYNQTDSYSYDTLGLGNLKVKGQNTYAYGTCGAGPHAVCAVGGGAAFAYDENGNMTGGADRTLTYNSANKVVSVQSDGQSQTSEVDFIYGADGQRVVQSVSTSGSPTQRTVYVGLGSTGKSLYERTTAETATPSVRHVNFIYAGGAHMGNAFALRVIDGSTIATKYQSFDHLGSVTAVSDERGHVASVAEAGPDAGVLGYDVWGAQRSPDGHAANPSSFNPPVGHREFTGQEAIPGVGLVNMNGRVYDPVLGRFLSPDPTVQSAADLQALNRYTYVQNNPLRSTDPTGYFTVGGVNIDGFANVYLGIIALAVCAGTDGAGCGLAFALVGAVYNSSSMLYAGATFEHVAAVNAVGILAGGIGGALGGQIAQGLGGGLAANMVGGGVAGVVEAAMSSAILGGDPDILLAAAQGAAWSGLAWGSKQPTPLDKANSGQGGGGSGEASVERAASTSAQAGDADELNGVRTGPEPHLEGREPTDAPECGTDVACVTVHSAQGRSAADRAQDQLAADFANRDTAGYRNARAATVGEQREFGAEIGQGGLAPTRQGSAYGFQPDLSQNPDAIAHTHIEPGRNVSIGDIQYAERHNVGVYTFSSAGESLYYDPRTNVRYYLEYLGTVK